MANSVTVEVERAGDGWVAEVEVESRGRRTHHSVRIARADLARWGGGEHDSDAEDLVRRSFAFLLEREPAGSILRSFDLSVIERYFPEFDQLFKR